MNRKTKPSAQHDDVTYIAYPKEDGSYDIYMSDVFIENVPTLEYYRGITILPQE